MAAGRGGFGRSSGGGLGSGLVAVKVVVNSAQTILTEVGSFEPYPLINLNLKAYVLGFFSSPAHLLLIFGKPWSQGVTMVYLC